MIYRYKKAFSKRFDRYSRKEQIIIWQAVVQIQHYLKTGKASHGLRITLLFRKKSLGAVYEARATDAIRIICVTKENLSVFSLVGNHKDVRQFIRDCR
jgi:hypothetical protein